MANNVLHDPTVGRNDDRVATGAALTAMGLGIAATVACPVAPVATLLAAAAGAYVADRAVRANEAKRRDRLEMVRPRWNQMDVDDLPLDNPDLIYLGEGYKWTHQETQRFHDEIIGRSFLAGDYRDELIALGKWPSTPPQDGRSAESVAESAAKAEGGDPRFLGLGWKKMESVYLPKKLLFQHFGCWGTTGSGKTRSIEGIAAWCARHGHALLIVDPKGDPPLTSLLWGLAERFDRGWTWVSLSHPDKSATYNPLLSYADPVELRSRVQSLIPDSPDQPFWSQTPGNAAGAVLITQAWTRNLVAALGSTGGCMSPLHQAAGFAMQFAADAGSEIVQPDHVVAGWQRVVDETARLSEIPQTDATAYCLTYDGLAPSFRTLYRFAVDDPRAIIATALKAIHPEWFAEIDPARLAAHEAAKQVGRKKDDPPYRVDLDGMAAALSPIEDGWDPAAYAAVTPANEAVRFTPAALEALWAPVADRREAILAAMHGIRETLGVLLDWSQTEKPERTRYCSSLKSAVDGLLGRFEIVDSKHSQLDLKRMLDGGEIGYLSLNTLSYKETAKAFGKIIISDLAALAGKINSLGGSKGREIFVLIDEIASFATPELIECLRMARSAGIHIMTLGQQREGVDQVLGSAGQRKEMLGNQAVTVQLRAGTDAEAEEAVGAFPQTTIRRSSTNSSAADSLGDSGHSLVSLFSGNIGRSHQLHDTKLVPPQLVLDLPQGAAVIGIDRVPHVVQFPQIIVKSAKNWYEQIHIPLPDWYLKKLVDADIPIPDWHLRLVAAQEAAASTPGAPEAA